MEMFNEIMMLLTAQTLYVFTDFYIPSLEPQKVKYNFGWYLTGIILFTIGVNTLVSFWISIKKAFDFIRIRVNRCLEKINKSKEMGKVIGINPLPSLLNDDGTIDSIISFDYGVRASHDEFRKVFDFQYQSNITNIDIVDMKN